MADEQVLVALSDAMADAVERAGAATVMVDGRRRLPATGIGYAENLVLTADHVVERDDDVHVGRPDGTTVDATVAGRDPRSDLALLRVDGAVAVAECVDTGAKVGQIAIALGRPSRNGIEASWGIVSSIGGPARTRRGGMLEQYIRTDAIPYPGFSGGPLIDGEGRVIGINTSGLTGGSSITIPSDLAWSIAGSLAEHGQVKRGYLGVRSQVVEIPQAQQEKLERAQAHGLLLVSVVDESPAGASGLFVGDILVAFNEQPVTDPDELQQKLFGSIVGKTVPVQVLRGGEPQTLSVTVGAR